MSLLSDRIIHSLIRPGVRLGVYLFSFAFPVLGLLIDLQWIPAVVLTCIMLPAFYSLGSIPTHKSDVLFRTVLLTTQAVGTLTYGLLTTPVYGIILAIVQVIVWFTMRSEFMKDNYNRINDSLVKRNRLYYMCVRVEGGKKQS